ncbi:flagellar export chaperone FlgN [Plesiomonas shigelloides]|uniref:flagellar export chaperone FlgN n=1 Tax=Plesiomonas shigelloides TaxID=703 RepID=UPI0028882B63|nr:flagellar export chaperone FlgN [Plesiomonas shigelloides]MDT1011792.1 flagellar export chaperone FlgN [Plesiomonas shigelloides]
MDRKSRVKALLQTLAHDVRDYQQLQPLLQQQYTLMQQRDSRGLTDSNHQLQPLLHTLQQRATKRCQHLQALGLPADDHGMQALFRALPEQLSASAQQQWQQLHQLIQACQQQNSRNGKLLAQQKQLVTQLLKPDAGLTYAPR